ncbi:MAG: dienelactone hydrolase family protein [Acidimicrobiales bacterium]
MAHIVLFHHAMGVTTGVESFAERLRIEGHVVAVPDLFDGNVFDDLEAGVAFASEIGFGELIARGEQECAELDEPTVFAGMSLGVLPAQKLAQTHRLAVGALLLHSCVPVSEFSDRWPEHVPVQVHAMEADPWFVDDGDIDAARALVASTSRSELFLYPGDQHLFCDDSLPSHDRAATSAVLERAVELLARIDS